MLIVLRFIRHITIKCLANS